MVLWLTFFYDYKINNVIAVFVYLWKINQVILVELPRDILQFSEHAGLGGMSESIG
jgi:hypothetical protein